jgi:hypothetical protein
LDFLSCTEIPSTNGTDEISQSSPDKEEHYDKKIFSPPFNVIDNFDSSLTASNDDSAKKGN